ncbi:aminopeptidase P N-terminal domain-containing protein [Flavobacterium sp. IMCC34518]|uniref:aminopeptidase P N-terminal domain-containing protein n=1 Tax=Flavobacterium sp. IMCC34518 TaxID=3003623 RepID=UPI002482BDE7|nr:aminopeptidase P N-terminal domain-containing protein [Flavobacterium sp. IMCC34518]
MKIKFSIILIITIVYTAISQNGNPNDYLTPQFHKARREALRKKMPKNSVAVFFGNPIHNRANDVDFVYHQDPNLYYLTGYKESNCVLLIFSDKQTDKFGKIYNEQLYIQEKNPKAEQWTGIRLGIEGAVKKLGFDNALNGKEFLKESVNFYSFDNVFFTEFKEDYRDLKNEEADIFKLVNSFKKQIGYSTNLETNNTNSNGIVPKKAKIDTKTLNTYMASLREIKSDEEIQLLTKTIRISAMGQREIMKAMHTGMSEAEIQGVHEFIYKKYGSEYEGYPSIVGAGNNGCVLHYSENSKIKVENELVLMDLGAEYHGYTADLTRTIPANGKFSEEQKIIYDLVYEAQEKGIESVRVGNVFTASDQAARKVITNGLLQLGIIKKAEDSRKYFPHGTTHHIGLDVHDPGLFLTFEKNMVVTVEPGIYIPIGSNCDPKWWGIAVRIEDNILVTNGSPINLSEIAPRKSNKIEALMSEKSVLNDFILPEID